ncbi:MAG: cadherin repeat domain-containing protein [Parachlamydiaceae bacterium]
MYFYLLALLLMPLATLLGVCDDRYGDGAQNVLPSLRVVLPYAFDDSSAASLILQGGENNMRANATLGAYFTDQQRVKASYDFMEERLAYRFCTGKTHKWMQQHAGGIKYDYLLDDCSFKTITIGGFYSYAPSKKLSSKQLAPALFLDRHISGSNYWNVDIGTTASLWEGGFLGVEVNYARLTYNNKFYDDKKLNGVGAKVTLDQYLWNDFRFHAEGEWRRFSRYIEGRVSKAFCFECGTLDVGVFASRLVGEHGLGDNTRYGIELGLGVQGASTAASYYTYDPCRCRTACDLIAWIAEAAVEMPAIYAIAEQRVRCSGTPVALQPTVELPLSEIPLLIPAAQYFTGDELFYSVSGVSGGTVVIDSSTGVVSVSAPTSSEITFTVQATNGCGAAQVVFDITDAG